MKIISTTPYTSTVREFSGFTSQSVQKSELAVDFGDNTMSIDQCLSYLYNTQVIDYKTRKSLSKKSDDKKISVIELHYSKFTF